MILFFLACSGSGSTDSAIGLDTQNVQGDGLDEVDPADLPTVDGACREPELVILESVVDGDTAWFTTNRGSEIVRFIGIDTPERGWEDEPSDCFAEEATARTMELLDGGRAWITFDQECEDHYDRTLGYIHIGLGAQNFIQRDLLRGGFATIFEVSPNMGFASEFSMDEGQASAAGLGLWTACSD